VERFEVEGTCWYQNSIAVPEITNHCKYITGMQLKQQNLFIGNIEAPV
jgi:hypothetical protein